MSVAIQAPDAYARRYFMVKTLKITELAPGFLQFAKYSHTDYAYADGVVTHTVINMVKNGINISVMVPHDGSETFVMIDDGIDDDAIDWEKVAEDDMKMARGFDSQLAEAME